MTLNLLILAIVRQTTVLIAQLATARGSRAPLAQVASQVFLDLVRELERQGVGRKVSADMFGLGLRTFQRKVQRLTESTSEHGRSLWTAILDFISDRGAIARAQVLLRFVSEDEALVRAILHDLVEVGLVTVSGTGTGTTYSRTSDDEIARLCHASDDSGLDELVWALVYSGGPQNLAQLVERYGDVARLEAALERLAKSGRIERSVADGTFRTKSLTVPLGSPVGWEAAVFDHYQAMVRTISCRLRLTRAAPSLADRIGGSTYSFEVWPDHPHAAETYATLGNLRAKLSELRARIESYNAQHEIPEKHMQVTLYVGQCLIAQGVGELDANQLEAGDVNDAD
ncbi:MAG TPA: hypothetical protein VIV60_11410 [Polyangiaceae bacterium]